MDDKKLDKLLRDIGMEEHIPSIELVEVTKLRIKRNPMVKYMLIASFILNFLTFILLMYIMVCSEMRLIYKAAIYIIVSTLLNFVIVLVYLYREPIKSLLKNSGLDYI